MFWRSRHEIDEAGLSAYADGALEAPLRARIEAHVPSCQACRGTLDEIQALRSSLRGLPRAAAPRSFALREADLQREPSRPRWYVQAPGLLGGVAAAAVIAFVALVGIDVSGGGTQDNRLDTIVGFNRSGDAASPQALEFGPQRETDVDTESDGAGELPPDESPADFGTEGGEGDDGGAPVAPDEAQITPLPAGEENAIADEGGADEDVAERLSSDDSDGDTAIRIAQAVAAAVGLAAIAAFAFVWRRGRA